MSANFEDYESSRISLDVSYRNSQTLREGESRRRNLIRNNIPIQMIDPSEDDIQQEDDCLEQNVNEPSMDCKNNIIFKDSSNSITFNNRNLGLKVNTSNQYDNLTQGMSFLSDNINFEDISLANVQPKQKQESYRIKMEEIDDQQQSQILRSQIKSQSFQPVSINQSAGEYYLDDKTPLSIRKLNLRNLTQVTTVSGNFSCINNLSNLNNKHSLDVIAMQQTINEVKSLDVIAPKSDKNQKAHSSMKFQTETGGSKVLLDNTNNSRLLIKSTQNIPSINLKLQSNQQFNIYDQEIVIKEKRKISIFNFKFFKRTQIINKFLSNLKSKTATYLFRHINSSQFNFISDKTADFSFYQDRGILSEQESVFSLIWQIILILIYLFFIFFLPIDNNFQPKFLEVIYPYIFSIVEKAIYKRGMISKNREAIFKEFLRTDSMLDLIVFIIYLFSQIFPVLKIFEYIITAKIIQVVRIIQQIFQRYDQQFKYTTLSKVIILIVIILTFLHTQAAIFVRIGMSQLNTEYNWISNIQPVDYSSYNIYIHSIYWSIMTMATVGYGDIHPVSQIEIIYVSIVSLISCGIYGYGLNQIGQIVNEIQKKNEDHNKQMQILNSLMNQRQIDKQLQNQVRKYFEYLFKEEQLNDENAIQLIQLLPYGMKNNILFDMNHKLLYSQKLFSLNFSKEFLQKLSLEMKIMNLGPEIEIFNKGQVDERIYFITKGRVDISIHLNSKQKTCYSLEKGDMLGELEFFTREVRITQAKTVGVVSITYLDFKDFFRCLQQFQNDLEKYYTIKDKAKLYDNISQIGTQCKGCKKFSHTFLSCPSLNLVTNIPKIIKESQKSIDQQRDSYFKRLHRKKFNAFYQFEQNKKGYTQIICYDDITDDIRENSISQRQTQQLPSSSLSAFQKQQSFNFKQYKNSDDTGSKQQQQQIENDMNSSKNLPPESPQLIHQKRPTIIESSELSKKMPQLFRGQSKKSSMGSKSIADQIKPIKSQSIIQQNNITEDPRTPTNTTQKKKQLFEMGQKDQQNYTAQQQLLLYTNNMNQSLMNASQIFSFNQQIQQLNQNNQQLHSPISQKYVIQNMQALPMNKSIIYQSSEIDNNDNLDLNISSQNQQQQDENDKINGDLSLAYDIMIGYSSNNIRYYVNQEFFDSFKIFKFYFPQNNITSVLKAYNRFLKFKNSPKLSKKNKKQTSNQ